MSKIVRLGFLGFGVVGSKVYEMIMNSGAKFEEQYGVKLEVKSIYVRNKKKKRAVDFDPNLLTDNASDVVNDPEVDIIVECLGGAGTAIAKELLLTALNHKMDLVMSSKKCLALYGEELETAAKENGCTIRYEATVGGGIPIMRALMEIAKGETIEKIYGILNATSNFILSSMTLNNLTYEEALEQAQIAGYAENDPSEDVQGKDAGYKLGIMVYEAMGVRVNIDDIKTKSIETVTADMLKKASLQGEVVKQVAYAKRLEDGTVECGVEPKMVEKKNLMAFVESNHNVIFVEGDTSGVRAFYGQGAGAGATASVMVDDIVDIMKKRSCK